MKPCFLTKGGESSHSLRSEICPFCALETPKVLLMFARPPPLLQELLTLNSRQARHFRKYLRSYNGAMAMDSVRAISFLEELGRDHITRQ